MKEPVLIVQAMSGTCVRTEMVHFPHTSDIAFKEFKDNSTRVSRLKFKGPIG